jgi:plastocyanin
MEPGGNMRRLLMRQLIGWLMAVSMVWTASALAVETVALTLSEHRFVPAEVTVPAGERLRIEVTNRDKTPSEFESSDLRIEKIVPPAGKIVVNAGPLKPGTYRFFDEYHPETATGQIIAVEKRN